MEQSAHKTTSTGSIRENLGRNSYYMIPKKQYDQLVEKVDQANELNDFVEEPVVARWLHCSTKRIKNMVAEHIITSRMYCKAVNGMKLFYLPAIMGIEKLRHYYKRIRPDKKQAA